MSAAAASKITAPVAARPSQATQPSAAKSARTQTRLIVNMPGDDFEREADRMADAVVSRRAGPLAGAAPITRRSAAVQRTCTCGSSRTTPCAACEEEQLQRKAADRSAPGVAPPLVHAVLATSGRPLEAGARRFMESRLGSDFGNVRIHADAQAAESARQVRGLAYTVGPHIVFGAGQYAPGTPSGDRLIAHELVHTLQQQGAPRRVQRVCYEDECDSPSGSEPLPLSSDTSNEAFVDPGWRNVQELGIVYKEGPLSQGGGANLKAGPGGEVLEWMPHNTKVFVIKAHDARKAYAVTRAEGSNTFGYVAESHIKLHLPDPESRIVKVKAGDTSLGLAQRHYSGTFNDAWVADQRYAVNALYWANTHQRHKSDDPPAIEKKDTWVWREFGALKYKQFVKADSDDAPWETVQVNAGRYLWLPGEGYLRSLYQVVREKGGGTGSIKAEIWQTVKGWYHKAAYAIAFAAGIIHGFVKSIWDAIAGIADLLYSFLKSLFSGELISDIKDLAGSIKKMLSEEGRSAVGEAISSWAAEWDAKLKDSSPWISGHAHGYLTGYVMAEAAMLLLTFGGSTALKGALWESKLGQIVKGSRAIQTLEKATAKGASIARATNKRFVDAMELLKKNRYAKAAVKTAEATAHAVVWTAQGVMTALDLPFRMLSHLTDSVIDRLKQLRDLFPRIKGLSQKAKWWLFECHSPCKVDIAGMRRRLKRMTNKEIDDFVAKLDVEATTPKVKGGKIEDRKVPTGHVRRMEAEDIPRISKTETLEQAKARIQTVIGKTIADDPAIRKLWDEAAAEVLRGKRLTKKNAVTMYERTRNKFWEKVRENPSLFSEAGFALPRTKTSAPYLRNMRKNIRDAEITISLDHAAEKAIGSNWKKALDPTNLVYEFAAPNSWREIIQMRHPVLRP